MSMFGSGSTSARPPAEGWLELPKGDALRRIEDDEGLALSKKKISGEPLPIIGNAHRLDCHVLNCRDLHIDRHENNCRRRAAHHHRRLYRNTTMCDPDA